MKTIKRVLTLFLKLLVASGITMLIASFFSTQRVISSLGDIGGKVQFSERLSMTFYDALHFGSLYWAFITIAFLVAFMAAWALYKGVKFGRRIIYIVSGITAIFVMLWAMEQVFFGVPIVAGARDGIGLTLQMLTGGIGGFIFALLTKKRKREFLN